jgi:hypothetical protein
METTNILIDFVKERGVAKIINDFKYEFEIYDLCKEIVLLINEKYEKIMYIRELCFNGQSHKYIIKLLNSGKIHENSLLISILFLFIKKHNKNVLSNINQRIQYDLEEYINDAEYSLVCYDYDYFIRELNFNKDIDNLKNKIFLLQFFK